MTWPPSQRVSLLGGRVRFEFHLCPFLAAATLAVVVVGSAFGVAWFWSHGITVFDVVLLVTMKFVTGLGISLGYHRLFAHQAFEAKPGLRLALGVLGASTLQGAIALWVSSHRRHHRFADGPGDPHTPAVIAPGPFAAARAFLHAHVGNLARDRCVRFVDRWYFVWAVAGWVVPGLIGAAWYGGWEGYWSGFFAGGPLRSLVQLNLTWLVNSLSHVRGRRPFATQDDSRNNALVNALTMNGEGLHNNHHAFPWSANMALFPGEFDPSYRVLRVFERLGWASNVSVPTAAQIARRTPTAAASQGSSAFT
jgi:stearoyl-CoA desaturase (Delta-9 desaturase)